MSKGAQIVGAVGFLSAVVSLLVFVTGKPYLHDFIRPPISQHPKDAVGTAMELEIPQGKAITQELVTPHRRIPFFAKVQASSDWQQIVEVPPGTWDLSLTAVGEVTACPGCPLVNADGRQRGVNGVGRADQRFSAPGLHSYSLVGRVGGVPFQLGTKSAAVLRGPAVLRVRFNDCISYADNRGEFLVEGELVTQ